METKSVFILTMLIGIVIAGCSKKPEQKTLEEVKETKLISKQFPEAQKEVKAVLDSLFASIQNRNVEELLSYHLYSDKFTEFRDGLPRTGSSENETYERALIEKISAFNYDLGSLKIDIFDKVAIVTFNADFRPTIGENIVQLWRQGTLVFVKNKGVWRITHEHFSPMKVEESE